MQIDWHFETSSPNDVERDPIQEEFFSSSNTLTDLSSLVRESIQNSLDAQLEDGQGPVRVVFTIGQVDAAALRDKYFSALDLHLSASLTKTHHLPAEGVCRFLAVEDFGTTGLLGRVTATAADARANRKENSYRYFAWTNGSSPKSDGRRGKWGVGKVVFPKISSIKTFFAYSVRSQDGSLNEILFGQSVLKAHDLRGTSRKPDGWWGTKNTDDRSIPLGSDEVPAFRKDWQIKRQSNQTGLSIVVPFIDDTFTAAAITECVLHDYFISLADGTLVVEVHEGESSAVIDASCIRDHLATLSETSAVKAMASIYLDHCNAPLNPIEVPFPSRANQWSAVDFSDAERATWRERLDAGETLMFTIPTKVSRTVDDAKDLVILDSFDVFLTRLEGVREKPLVCREGILIPNAAHQHLHDTVGLVHVKSGKLADLLGDAEGPAHERWSEQGDRFKDKYVPRSEAKDVLTWVRSAPAQLMRMLRVVDDGRDDYQLGRYFPMPGDSGNEGPKPDRDAVGAGAGDGGASTSVDKPVIDVPPTGPQGLAIRKTEHGFRICSTPHTKVGQPYHVAIAYSLRRGNPFTKWLPADFNLEEMRSGGQTNCTFFINKNVVTIAGTGGDFELQFDGFDPLRDLSFNIGEGA